MAGTDSVIVLCLCNCSMLSSPTVLPLCLRMLSAWWVEGRSSIELVPRGVPAGLSGVSQAGGDAVVPLEECS